MIKTTLLIFLGLAMTSGSNFLFYVIIARLLGPNNFGEISSVISIVSIATLVAGFGTTSFWLKIFAKENSFAKRWIKPTYAFLSISGLTMFLLVNMWGKFGPHPDSSNILFMLISTFIFQQVCIDLVSKKYQLEEKYLPMIIFDSSPNLLKLIFVLYFSFYSSIALTSNVVASIYFYISLFVIFITSYFLIQIRKHGILINQNEPIIKENFISNPNAYNVFIQSSPFAFGLIFSYIFNQSNIIFLRYLLDGSYAGYYSASYLVFSTFILVPTVLYQKYFIPQIHRWAYHDKTKLYKFYLKGNLVMFFLGCIVSIVLFIFAEYIIISIYGEDYKDSVSILKLLCTIIPLILVSINMSAPLFTRENMKSKAIYMFVASLINIILNIVLIPQYLALGAVYATIISNIVLFLLYYYHLKKYIFN